MMTKTTFSGHLLGCLELFLFMPKGIERFGSDYKEMIQSLFIPAIVLPVFLIAAVIHPRDDMEALPQNLIIILHSLHALISISLLLGIVYFFAKNMKDHKPFIRFVTTYNWLALPNAVLSIPLVIMLVTNSHSFEEIHALAILLFIYSSACIAFMTAHTLKIPIELGGAVALFAFVIDQTTMDLLGWFGSFLS